MKIKNNKLLLIVQQIKLQNILKEM